MLSHIYFGLALTMIPLGLVISARAMHGQTMSFFRQFTTPGMTGATAVVADASGIYVIGSRPASANGPGSAAIRKYDSRGNELWTREGTLSGAAVADGTGLYVLGQAGMLRKYSADGNELWTRQLGFGSPFSVGADATGVYVSGRSFPTDYSYLRKYDTDGAELWTNRSGTGGPSQEFPLGTAADATGVYLVGLSGGGPYTGFLRKFDALGNQLWTRSLDKQPSQVAAAAPTGFYVVSAAGATFASDPRAAHFLSKYDSAGNELWSRPMALASPPVGIRGIAVDATGVYVVGGTGYGAALPGQCRSGSGGDAFVRRYDPNGAEVWAREFGASQSAGAAGVAVDAGGVYVAGSIAVGGLEFDGGGNFRTDSSVFLAKFEKSPALVPESGPRIFPDCVVNAASYVGGGVAPGEIVTLFGSAIGPLELIQYRLTEDRQVATTLADTRILFDGMPAPLLYVSEKQSSAIVPYALAGRTSVDVQVEYKGARSDSVIVPVLASRPGIFSLDSSGQGQGAILNENGTVNSQSNPARRGSVITIFGTGGGEAAAGVSDGQIVSDILPKTSLPVSVWFFDADFPVEGEVRRGDVLYAGGSSGSAAGLLQVNIRVPANVVTNGGPVSFALIIGSQWTAYQVTIALQ